ncbi:MAG TPA: SpoIIE family protein phosphatase [Synergistaceae bacterium]|nr:SpoIIE family protein phosphatase [Synergistaceae bacterium]
MFPRHLGIAGKLALMTMGGAGFLFLAIVGYGYFSSLRAVEQEFRSRLENLGEATASKIRRIPRVAEAVTQDLATALRFFQPSPDQVPEMLRRLLAPHPEVSGLFVGYARKPKDPVLKNFCPVVFREGEKIVFQNLADGADWIVTDWYQLPLQLRKPVWTEPFFSGNGNDGRIVVNYSVPFYDDHWKYVASIGASIEVHWLTDVLASLKVGDEGYVFLITPNGTMVSHPRGEWIMKETVFTVAEEEGNREKWDLGRKMRDGERGLGSFTNLRTGDRYLIYYQPIEGMGWSLGIVFPEKVILAGVTRLSHTQMALGLLGMGGMLLVALATARRITRPIRALSDATQVLASGHLEAPLPSGKGHDEVAHLTVSFATMRDSLLNHMKDLAASTAKQERIASELDIARSIQMSLVPRTFPPFPDRRDFDLFALLEPAREVGGDFYDFFKVDEHHLLLTIGDVSGKGVPAALFMAVTRSFVRAFAGSVSGPGALLAAVNDEIVEGNDACMFVTLFCALVDLRDGSFRYANGGHNTPWRVGGGTTRPLPAVAGTLVGFARGKAFEEGSGRLAPGEALFLYTDGVTEALNPAEELLGEERTRRWLAELSSLESAPLLDEMRRRISSFAEGAEQSDDITMMCFRYWGAGERLKSS